MCHAENAQKDSITRGPSRILNGIIDQLDRFNLDHL